MLKTPLDFPLDAVCAKKPKRVPTVLTKEETLTVIEHLSGTQRFMAKLLCGGGSQLMECLRLRVDTWTLPNVRSTYGMAMDAA